ncbi:aldehyde dehydrogenase [Planctomycetota bacterium]|nr:aldehyde dehydrogenase family protein [Planctomycetota bacterium]GDY01965.1 aldehyde dehydrogenase [Planctomycetota bacterium]
MTLPVKKTYKLFVGGKFPRSESARSYQPSETKHIHVTRGSRKDLRDAVLAARIGQKAWSSSSAYLRGQILYRLAEMLETRSAALCEELAQSGVTKANAKREVLASIALAIWYAGLPDKLQSLLGSQNAVQGPFFSFSTIEPSGVVGVIAPETPSLLGMLALCLPVLVSGNAVVALCSESAPCASLALGEVFATSDFPGGTINLLAGLRSELAIHFASHRDIDGLLVAGKPDALITQAAADNVKRVRYCDLPAAAFRDVSRLRSLHWVEPFVEVKTLWHPVAQ